MNVKLACLLAVLAVACCVMESEAGTSSRLAIFLRRLNAKKLTLKFRLSPTQSIIEKIKQKAQAIYKKPTYFVSKPVNKDEVDAVENSSEEEEVGRALDEIYKDMCKWSCKRTDSLCVKVLLKYLRPLCNYRSAPRAAYQLRKQIGCKEMTTRAKIICKASSKNSGCTIAKQVAEFCLAEEENDDENSPSPPNPKELKEATTKPPATNEDKQKPTPPKPKEQRAITTKPTTTTTTEATTTTTTVKPTTTTPTEPETNTIFTTEACRGFGGLCVESCGGTNVGINGCAGGSFCCVVIP